MPAAAARKIRRPIDRTIHKSRRTVRGGYAYTYEQALQMATAIARHVGEEPPRGVDDIGGILNLINDILDGYDLSSAAS
ncbi:hypothetical protein BV20DRAFT_365725 [Pilatotrama ljubarskyi]|nr:hypothetical protein BV20DRAFT_365725 [Pilatotrama ljubarskyi]